MVATNETPATPAPPETPTAPDAPARYWPGYDTLAEEIARANAELAERNGKNFRDGWWRHNTLNKELGPLKSTARYRRTSTHALINNKSRLGSGTEQHHCSCGLIVDIPELPDLATQQFLDERDAAFLAAPGHIDWRMRDPERYPEPAPQPDPEPVAAPAVAAKQRKYFWELGMYLAFYGPPQLHTLAKQRGDHLPLGTHWPRFGSMPYRKCSCGLRVDAPDLVALRHEVYETKSPGTYWPNDPIERERIQRDFFEAKGHKRLRVQEPESTGGLE